jgi:hypothetical protein
MKALRAILSARCARQSAPFPGDFHPTQPPVTTRVLTPKYRLAILAAVKSKFLSLGQTIFGPAEDSDEDSEVGAKDRGLPAPGLELETCLQFSCTPLASKHFTG